MTYISRLFSDTDTTRTMTMSFPSWSLTQAVPIHQALPPPFVPPLQVALARYSNLCCWCLTPLWSRMEAEEKSASHWRGRGSALLSRYSAASLPAVCATTCGHCRRTESSEELQQTRRHLEGCPGSPGIWIARTVCLLHMWLTARSYTRSPLWMTTRNFWDTSGESTCTPSSMNGFSSWLTS